jgi:anti-sigma regulatory factor (Ser/Thr protein kinase)
MEFTHEAAPDGSPLSRPHGRGLFLMRRLMDLTVFRLDG